MCNKTFPQLFQDALDAPTPRQVFMKKACDATGKTQDTIYRWIKGKGAPNIAEAEALARAFGSDVQTLFPKKE